MSSAKKQTPKPTIVNAYTSKKVAVAPIKNPANQRFNNLHVPAYVLSILGGIYAIGVTISSIVVAIFMLVNYESWLNLFIDKLYEWFNPVPADMDVVGLGTLLYDTGIILLFVAGAWYVACAVFNWCSVGSIAKTMHTGQYSLALAILQLFSFPFGTVSGILMIVARHKNIAYNTYSGNGKI